MVLLGLKIYQILVKGPTQELYDTILTAEVTYPTNFPQPGKRFVLQLHLFANTTKVYQFQAKRSEIEDYALCLDNVSKGFTVNNKKKQD